MTESLPRTRPEGSSESLKVLLPMTRVWPALWPPWKRTTTSARSESQSTIFPLPSSPHWAPITATFAIGVSLNLFFPGRRFEPRHSDDLAGLPEMRAGQAARLGDRPGGRAIRLRLKPGDGAVAVLAEARGNVGRRAVGHVDALGHLGLRERAQDRIEIEREAGRRLLRARI